MITKNAVYQCNLSTIKGLQLIQRGVQRIHNHLNIPKYKHWSSCNHECEGVYSTVGEWGGGGGEEGYFTVNFHWLGR